MWYAVLVVGVILGSGVALYLLIRGWLDRLSGWNELAVRYPAHSAPEVWDWSHQTVRVGAVRYRRVMRLAVRPEGLYLDEAGLRRHPMLCIPWEFLRHPSPTRFYGRPAVRVTPGSPGIDLPAGLYESVMRQAPR